MHFQCSAPRFLKGRDEARVAGAAPNSQAEGRHEFFNSAI